MKSSLRKIRDFALHRGADQGGKDGGRRRGDGGPHLPASPHEELLQAAKEMHDMKNGYDSLLSAAAATANSAYEFSEALQEMGSCLLEKIALNNDDESRKVLWMLGKAQFELQKFVDSYRAHVIQTITTPSESLIKELQTVEEMKRQCDDKRDLYKFMQATQRDSNNNNKGAKYGNKQGKGTDSFTYEQVKQAQDEYNDEASLFVFRLKSLKQGQFRSLLTQAIRHHAAQLNFFKKGVRSLEAVEPQVRAVADSQRIDYHFTELDDDFDDEDDGDVYPDGDDNNSNDGSELSFDYGQGKRASNATAQFPRKSLEDHTDSNQSDTISFTAPSKPISQSEPILANKTPDPSDRMKVLLQRIPSTKRNPTYVLPTPTGENYHPRPSLSKPPDRTSQSQPLWFSSPLQPNPNAAIINPNESEHLLPTPQKSPLKESNIVNPKNKNRNPVDSDAKKAKISELHELPRPPPARSPASTQALVPHSAPLVSKANQEKEKEKRIPVMPLGASKNVPSPLPAPPVGVVMARSYSIPSRGTDTREDAIMDGKFKQNNLREVVSPPLSPIALRNAP